MRFGLRRGEKKWNISMKIQPFWCQEGITHDGTKLFPSLAKEPKPNVQSESATWIRERDRHMIQCVLFPSTEYEVQAKLACSHGYKKQKVTAQQPRKKTSASLFNNICCEDLWINSVRRSTTLWISTPIHILCQGNADLVNWRILR